ncbi:MAG: hypothetical protein MJK11_06670, partial [Pseudomonadales bacterium]|nr:hypothetical protein [Pseudomonadales bacterium]
MIKIFTSFNFLALIPIVLFIYLIFSIISIIAYPYYSHVRLYIETNSSNSVSSIEEGTYEKSTIIEKSDDT